MRSIERLTHLRPVVLLTALSMRTWQLLAIALQWYAGVARQEVSSQEGDKKKVEQKERSCKESLATLRNQQG